MGNSFNHEQLQKFTLALKKANVELNGQNRVLGKKALHVEAHTLISSHYYVSECSSSFFRFVVNAQGRQ